MTGPIIDSETDTCAPAALQCVLDALPVRVALLDADGRVVLVNAAWRIGDAGDPVLAAAAEPGADFRAGCLASGADFARRIAEGVRAIAAGRWPEYVRQYHTDGPAGRHWWAVRARPFAGGAGGPAGGPGGAVGGAGGAVGGAGGRVGGVLITHEDVTGRRLAEHGRDLQFAVTRILSESATPEEGYPRLVEAICEGLEWDFGEIWTAEGEPVLRAAASWHPPDLPLEGFAAESRNYRFAPGSGLPGRTWVTGRPEWLADAAADPGFLRRSAAAEHGLHCAAAFPVPGPGGIVGVVVVFSREVRAFEPDTTAVMADLGMRIGQFVVRKRAQKAVQDAKILYQSLVETLPQHVYRTDLEGRLTFGNRHYCAGLGRPLEELLGKTAFDLFPAELAAKYAADDRAVIESGRPREEVERHVGADGRPVFVQVVKAPVVDSAGRVAGVQGIFWDITERKELEDDLRGRTAELERANQVLRETQLQLVAQERLAALGQLTAGVAHEINTPLAYLNNNLAVIERDMGQILAVLRLYRTGADPAEIARLEAEADVEYATGNLARLIDGSRKGVQRVRRIAVDLGSFSRLDQAEYDEADLDGCLDVTLELLNYELQKKSITIARDYGGLTAVACRPAKMNQVFLNILLNAVHASCPEGTIRISTRRAGAEAVVEIRDHGCGMTPEVRSRIFDPFFTTKPVGEGTGLGLSICYGIVRDHGGRIEVESEPGRGSMFRIVIPATGTVT